MSDQEKFFDISITISGNNRKSKNHRTSHASVAITAVIRPEQITHVRLRV